MAVTLDNVINSILQISTSPTTLMRYGYGRNTSETPVTPISFMEIPINEGTFEIPLFAFDTFIKINKIGVSVKMLVAQLYSFGHISQYKSLDSVMRDCIQTKFSKHLIKISIPNVTETYYCTYGAIFDSCLKPLMMLSWILEKKPDSNSIMKYHYKRALLRINPEVLVSKEDAVQKFIANKMLSSSLNFIVGIPYYLNANSFLEQNEPLCNTKVKVEIDECPFIIKRADIPSISVTNQELLQMAADHIDEMLQQ